MLKRTLRALCASWFMSCPVVLVAAPPNDLCINPEPIVGEGVFSFDLTDATASTAGGGGECKFGPTVENDVWFCWTSECSGTVRIETCGGTSLDTVLEIYDKCECPGDGGVPICCNDNFCGKQSRIDCLVECDRIYLIRLGTLPAQPEGNGTFTITCIDGPCGDPPPVADDCDTCCGSMGQLLSDQGFVGPVGLGTLQPSGSAGYCVVAFDANNAAASANNSYWAPPMYSHPDWNLSKLGQVFGTAIDELGNGYVAHTSCYAWGGLYPDTLGMGGAGAIYRLDAATGAPSVLATLPQTLDPTIVPANEGWPGIGNIHYDCQYQRLYASNMDDGRIYVIDTANGTIEMTYDHASGTVTDIEPIDPLDADGFAPLGERVWGLTTLEDRLYYAIWGVDGGKSSNSGLQNQIWSIALDVDGNPIAGTQVMEFVMPDYGSGWSNPVADLVFRGDCCLVTVERSMSGPSASGAHQSRALVHCVGADGEWINTSDYTVGNFSSGDNTSGGVAIDPNNGMIWFSGDALKFGEGTGEFVYGYQGTLVGGDLPNSVQVDADQDTNEVDKFQVGSIEVSCSLAPDGPCMEIIESTIECIVDENGHTGEFLWSFTIQYNGTVPAQYVLIPDPLASPSVIPLPTALGTGDTAEIELLITGLAPLDNHCFDLLLADENIEECCHLEHCVEMPECDCTVPVEISVECVDGGNGEFWLTMDLMNLSGDVVEHVFVVPPMGSGITMSPDYWDVPSTPDLAMMSIGPILVSGAPPAGSQMQFLVALHNQKLLECCSREVTITVPDCESGSGCPVDLNGDGVVDGVDLAILLGNWGGTGLGDINCDGVIDGADLALLLGAWGTSG
ncbi:MAG: hypothetical protein CMJ32_05160 [Phycisphaerae bacterium]|nr:hypothetical protein [Phycisphaerae bacterium]